MEKIVRQRRKKSKVKIITRKAMESMPEGARTIDGKAELIQLLIPLELKAVNDELQKEFRLLTGERYPNFASLKSEFVVDLGVTTTRPPKLSLDFCKMANAVEKPPVFHGIVISHKPNGKRRRKTSSFSRDSHFA